MKKKVVKKVVDEIAPEKAPEGMEGKARWLGTPIEDYARRVLDGQGDNLPVVKLDRVEKALIAQCYDVEDINEVVVKLGKELD